LRREPDPPRTEIVAVVFDEAGQKVGEGIFGADTDRPSRPRRARRIGGPEDDRRRPVLVVLPGAAGFDIAEQTIPRVADTAGDGGKRLGLAMICDADFARAGMAAAPGRYGQPATPA
jgi:hypothetical protein